MSNESSSPSGPPSPPPAASAHPQPNYPTKPKLTKAERRELQERQRAAKAASKQQQQPGAASVVKKGSVKSSETAAATVGAGESRVISTTTNTNITPSTGRAGVTTSSSSIVATTDIGASAHGTGGLFHLYPRSATTPTATASTVSFSEWKNYHPAVLRLGEQYATYEIVGGNRRCRAMLDCYKVLLQDCCTFPSSSSASDSEYREFVHHEILKPAFDYWTTHCRPHSVAMGNAFSFLKSAILTTTTTSSSTMSWNDFVRQISESIIDSYIRERIEYADKAIAEIAVSKIFGSTTNTALSSSLDGTAADDDGTTMMITILTYRYSEAVVGILVEASNQNKNIHVVVVEDRTMLYALRQHNISCEFVPFAGLSYVLQQQKEITFVLLGASALMSDGCVWGSIGTAVVALAAHAGSTTRPPVLVCAETYKISNRVQLDSWIFNEQQQDAAPKNMMHESFTKEQDVEHSIVVVPKLDLRYDLTPAELVDGIITELGIVPPTSVAVLLREMNPAELKNK